MFLNETTKGSCRCNPKTHDPYFLIYPINENLGRNLSICNQKGIFKNLPSTYQQYLKKYIDNSIIFYNTENQYDTNFKLFKYSLNCQFLYKEDLNQLSKEIFSKQAPIIICIYLYHRLDNNQIIAYNLLYCSHPDKIFQIKNNFEKQRKIIQQQET